jgi:type IV pilus assembly protein PilC
MKICVTLNINGHGSITESKTLFTKDIVIGNLVKLRDMVIYLHQFATLLKAGISGVDATGILAKQTTSKSLTKLLLDIDENHRSGTPLSSKCSYA